MGQNNCIFCMNPSSTDVCPHCGKSRSRYVAAPHHLSPGTLLNGRYEVGAVIGEGGFGITYIGKDIQLDMKVAIKEYFPSGFVNRNNTASTELTARLGDAETYFEKGKSRFLDEARTLAKFANNPNIVSVRDFFSANNTAYIVMEYLEGITLKDFLEKNGPMSFETAYNLLAPIMSALAKVHAKGLVHRDISPVNIMVLDDGTIKLLDFGAARDVAGAAGEKSLSILIKPGYAPEEQYRTRGNQGPWTDVYAIAATMYKMLTGVTPDDAMNRVFKDELAAPSAVNPSVTAQQDEAILKGMAIQQEDRFQSIEAFMEACRASLASGTGNAASEEKTIPGDEAAGAGAGSEAGAGPQTRVPQGTEAGEIPAHPAGEGASGFARQTKGAGGSGFTGQTGEAGNNGFTGQTGGAGGSGFAGQTGRAGNNGFAGNGFVRQPGGTAGNGGNGRGRGNGKAVQPAPVYNSGEKKPNIIFFILSTAAGFLSLPCLTSFTITAFNKYGDTSPVFAGVLFLLLAAAAVGFGILYYPRLHNKERKPNVFCLAASIIATVLLLFFVWSAYDAYANYYWNDGMREGRLAVVFSVLLIVLFFGYFYYPRLGRKGRKKALKIHGGLIGAGAVLFVVYLVFFSLNTINVGDTNIALDETNVYIYGDIITDGDLAKLKKLKKLEQLTLTGCFLDDADVKTLGELTTLTKLNISGNTDITDVSPLNNLTNLTTLNLSSTGTKDIACLSALTNLQELNVSSTEVSDVSVVETFESLTYLYINSLENLDADTLALPASLKYLYCNGDGISDLGFVTGSDSLQWIEASGNQITDISPMAKFDAIYTVDFSDNQITDISPVCKEGVNSLNFTNNKVEDISALAGNRVSELLLAGNQITDITALTDNASLRTLNLSGNQVADISALKDCFRIYNLNLSYNEVEDISALATVDELQMLNLRSNKIKDISPLASVKELPGNASTLDLRDNEIESVEALSGFTTLKYLYLSNNKISDVSPLAGCPELVMLKMNHNQVSDLSPLAPLQKLHIIEVVDNPVTDLSCVSVADRNAVLGGDEISQSTLRITYQEAIDWEALAEKEGLSTIIYGGTERQRANLKDMGFWNFGTEDSLDTD